MDIFLSFSQKQSTNISIKAILRIFAKWWCLILLSSSLTAVHFCKEVIKPGKPMHKYIQIHQFLSPSKLLSVGQAWLGGAGGGWTRGEAALMKSLCWTIGKVSLQLAFPCSCTHKYLQTERRKFFLLPRTPQIPLFVCSPHFSHLKDMFESQGSILPVYQMHSDRERAATSR